jgi:6-pyruvoyl-tetrahydropterin synthase
MIYSIIKKDSKDKIIDLILHRLINQVLSAERQILEKVYNRVWDQVKNKVYDQVWSQVYWRVREQVWGRVFQNIK